MMPFFGSRSLRELSTCHEDIQRVLNRAIEDYDFSVIKGHRSEVDQNAAVDRGASKLRFPRSWHTPAGPSTSSPIRSIGGTLTASANSPKSSSARRPPKASISAGAMTSGIGTSPTGSWQEESES